MQLRPYMEKLRPRPSVYYPDFIAANQSDRADNVMPGCDKWQHVQQIRADIQDFKRKHNLDKVCLSPSKKKEIRKFHVQMKR